MYFFFFFVKRGFYFVRCTKGLWFFVCMIKYLDILIISGYCLYFMCKDIMRYVLIYDINLKQIQIIRF